MDAAEKVQHDEQFPWCELTASHWHDEAWHEFARRPGQGPVDSEPAPTGCGTVPWRPLGGGS